jgi:hypothetical protein
MRFCSRCGLALAGLAEWLAGGLPSRPRDAQISDVSPRRKGMRRAAQLMFLSGVLFFGFLVISIFTKHGEPMVIPIMLFFISLVWMLYARLFSDRTAPMIEHAAQTSALRSDAGRGTLPPAINFPTPTAERQRVRTNELAHPPSVTEHTTKLLDNE